MAYSSRNTDDRYENLQDKPTISKLVQPSDSSYSGDRQNPDNPYTTRRQSDDRYTSDTRRTGDSAYESIRRSGDDQYTNQHLPGGDHRRENERRSSNFESTQRVPTADVFVDTTRRPIHGNARTCVMEINIAVSIGPNRTPQASFITSNVISKPPVIRSTATIDDAHYVDLKFQSPQNTAQLSTDGIIRYPSSPRSVAFRNENENE